MQEEINHAWTEQVQHEKTKAWMLEHGWSVSYSEDPADVYELLLEESDSDEDEINY